MKFYVYALLEPGTDAIRYIGKSSNPARRLASHMSKSSSPLVREWIADIGRPDLRILAEYQNETRALLAEQLWIKKLRNSGSLLNVAIHDRAPAAAVSAKYFTGFGDRCVARRKQLGLTQIALAARSGVPQPSVSCAESRNAGLSVDTAVRIARVLGVSVEWLVTGEERVIENLAAE